MDYTTQDDPTLIRLVMQAQADALSELYERYNRLVFSVALGIVGDRATAGEITLDVFMRVWQKAGLYREERAKVSTWLIHIARNHAIDVLRRQASRLDRRSASWHEVPPGALPAFESPERDAELALSRARVRAALARLPEEQRQVLALAYFKGYTQRQIAEALAQPLGTVKTRILLAMQKLRQFLQEEDEPPGKSGAAPPAYTIAKDS